jgi:uncharacterized protein
MNNNRDVTYIQANLKEEREKFEKVYQEASARNVTAQFECGVFAFCGIGIEQSYELSFNFLLPAALGGNVEAQYLVGVHYFRGLAVLKNDKKAVEFFELAASKGYLPAKQSLASFYQRGVGVSKNIPKTVELYTELASRGDSESQFRLALILKKEKNIMANQQETASNFLNLASRNGRFYSGQDYGCFVVDKVKADASFERAMLLLQNIDEGDNKVAVAGLLTYAANAGHIDAQYRIAEIIISYNIREAIRYLKLAAHSGHAAAQFRLSGIFQDGIDVAKDDAAAHVYCSMAAKQGLAVAQYNLAIMLLHGIGSPVNIVLAINQFKLSAMQGYEDALYCLACMYLDGKHLPVNEKRAIELLTRAANTGHLYAQFSLMNIYIRDIDKDGNIQKYFVVCKMAAEQGDRNALCQLGRMLEDGIGVFPDQSKALEYYKQASAQGHQQAIDFALELRAKMNLTPSPLSQNTFHKNNDCQTKEQELEVALGL